MDKKKGGGRWNGMEMEMGKGRLFSNNGIEKGTRNRARGREREKWKGQRISQGLTPIYYVSIPMYI